MNVQHLSKSVMRVFQTIESRTAWIHYMQTCIKKCEKGIRMIVCNVAKSKIIKKFFRCTAWYFSQKQFLYPAISPFSKVENLFGENKTTVPPGVLTTQQVLSAWKKNLIISITYEWFSSEVVNDHSKFTIRHDEFINVVISCSSSISRVALYYYLFLYVRCCLFLTLIYRLLGRFYIKECDVPPQGK